MKPRQWAEDHAGDDGEQGELARALVEHFDQLERFVGAVDDYMLENLHGHVTALDFELLTRERSIRG